MPPAQQKSTTSSDTSSEAAEDDLSADEDDTSSDDDNLGEEDEKAEYELDAKDLCIEIKLAKDHGEKSRLARCYLIVTLERRRQSRCCRTQVFGGEKSGSSQTPSGEPSSGQSRREDSSGTWLRWDPERVTRVNQDNQRELECSAFRTLVKQLLRKQQASQVALVTCLNK